MLIIIITDVIRETEKLTGSQWWTQVFQTFSYCLKTWNFITGKNTVSYFPWMIRLTLLISEEMSAKYPNLSNCGLLIALQSKNSAPPKKKQLVQLTIQKNYSCTFLWDSYQSYVMEVLYR